MKAKQRTTKSATKRGSNRLEPAKKSTQARTSDKLGAIADRLPMLDEKTIKLILQMQTVGWAFHLEDWFEKGEMMVAGRLEKELITKRLTEFQIKDCAAHGWTLEKIDSYAGYHFNARCIEENNKAMNAVFDASQLLEYYALKHAGLDFAASHCEFDTKKATAILEKVLKWTRGK